MNHIVAVPCEHLTRSTYLLTGTQAGKHGRGYTWPYSFRINPFTLRVPLEGIVCYFRTFENNLGIKQTFTKYLKESCCLTSGQHSSFKYFPKNAFVRKIFPKLSGWSECEWVK